jgi:hypothetical protein
MLKYYSTALLAAQEARQGIAGLPPRSAPTRPTLPGPDEPLVLPGPNRLAHPHPDFVEEGSRPANRPTPPTTDELEANDFNLRKYIEEKRKAAEACAPVTQHKKCTTRADNILCTESKSLAKDFFGDTKASNTKADEPEPPRIRPLLRYTPDEQQRIQRRLFAEAKTYIVNKLGKAAEEVEAEIQVEMDKRLAAWESSHYS